MNEKKHYKIEDIIKINNFTYELKHLETTFDLEKYNLEVNLDYVDSFLEVQNKVINLPIELNTTMTEQLTANITKLDIITVKNNGIDLDITLDIEVVEIESAKEEIKEIYQQELTEKMGQREDEIIEEKEELVEEIIEEKECNIFEIKTCENNDDETLEFSFLNNLKCDYAKYKVLSLDDSSLDKISAKYNLPMDLLYDAKKSNNKVIVYDKE